MPNPVRTASLAILLLATAAATRAADLPFDTARPVLAHPSRLSAGGGLGGGFSVPRWPVRPVPSRFDIYGFPLGPALVGRPNPHAIGVGCPPALEPVYDPDGNLAGYAPRQDCR